MPQDDDFLAIFLFNLAVFVLSAVWLIMLFATAWSIAVSDQGSLPCGPRLLSENEVQRLYYATGAVVPSRRRHSIRSRTS